MRHQDWPARLARFVAAARARPFDWAVQDCATFARDWIEECTGERVFDPPYTDALSATRFIDSQGGMLAAATAVLGEPMAHAQGARRGDVALVADGDRQVLGIVLGEHVAVTGEHGLRMAPRTAIVAAWSI